jgi:hypothetical protein
MAIAEAVVAFLLAASVGVPVEIDRAVTHGEHVVVFSDIDRPCGLTCPSDAVARYRSWTTRDVRHALGRLYGQGRVRVAPGPGATPSVRTARQDPGDLAGASRCPATRR